MTRLAAETSCGHAPRRGFLLRDYLWGFVYLTSMSKAEDEHD